MLPDRYVSIPRLREAARVRAEASSQRTVAREIGIAIRGFQLFLGGSRPQPKTLEKLYAWYRAHVERTEGPPISAADALLVLMHALPPDRRPAASSAVIATVRDVHVAAGVECPPELVALTTQAARPADGQAGSHMAE
jgi:hypothetical protein